MAKTLVGLYDDRPTAHQVLTDLEALGFGTDHLQFASQEQGDRTDYDVDGGADPDELARMGVPATDADAYAEGVRRGGSLVVARVHDSNVEQAADAMARHNPVPMDERRKAYEEDGFEADDRGADAYSDDEVAEERQRFAGDAQQRMTEIEERLKIGKREVVRGGVRVHKYVDTDVVEETLRLREERVDVDRTAVDRPATAEDLDDAFEETTVEMVERSEEAVVEKTAVVTGEVAVGKDVQVREETVGGKVRSTRVEVEQIDGDALTSREPDFKGHWTSTYADAGGDFETYRPAYGYGHAAGTQHGGRDFDEAEPELRTDYERTHKDSAWDDVKDAVRHAYDGAKDAVT